MIFSVPYKKKKDIDLVALISEGDRGAFKELLTRYQNSIYGFAFSMLRDTHEAEDVAQEVFLRLYRTAGSFGGYASLKAYLFRIARNLCIDHLRKMHPQILTDPPEPVDNTTPLNQVCTAELRQQIDDALSGLPENQKAAIYLRHEQGMSYKEISQALNVTVRAVESLLSRARKTFRSRFAG